MGSNSGSRTLQFNTRERAVSTDLNRAQSFKGADLAFALAYLYDYKAVDSVGSGSNGSIGNATTSPLRAMILGGLTVRPALGSANTTVDPGVLVCADPDPSPNSDDCPVKIVNDPGVTNGATLPMPANSSGATVISILECQRTDVVLETDNRDIFDPGSGTFLPALVNKSVASRLTYRFRTVALGSGATTAAGWLPLLVALVPNGSTTWDTVAMMWDVRPLAADREVRHAGNLSTAYGRLIEQASEMDYGTLHLRGRILACSLGGRIIGGDLGFDIAEFFLDLGSAEVQASGFAPVANRPVYLYVAEPYFLPRWCRYTSYLGSVGTRLPGKFRGIPILSTAAPRPVSNVPDVGPVLLPAATGFAQTAGQAVCVWAGMVDNGGAVITNGVNDGVRQSQFGVRFLASPGNLVGGTSDSYWNFVAGVNFPGNARAIWVKFDVICPVQAGSPQATRYFINATDQSGWPNNVCVCSSGTFFAAASVIQNMSAYARIPVGNTVPSTVGTLGTITVDYVYNADAVNTIAAPTTAIATIVGWELA